MPFVESGSSCSLCKLSKECVTPFLRGAGSCTKNPDVMFVTDYPSSTEDTNGAMGVGRDFTLIKKALEKLNIDSYYVTTAIACHPSDKKEPSKEIMASCRPRLIREIKEIQPKVIILLGNTSAKAVIQKDTISKLRKKVLGKLCDIPIYATYHPSSLLYDDARSSAKEFVSDIKLAVLGIDDKLPVDYKTLKTDKEVATELTRLSKCSWVSFDIETVGLDHLAKRAQLLTIAFSDRRQYGCVFSLKKSDIGMKSYKLRIAMLNKFFSKKKLNVIGHNAKFDCRYLYHFDVEVKNLGWDTQVAHYLLDESFAMPRLKALAKMYTDMGDYDAGIKANISRLDLADIDEVLKYNCADVDATFRIFDVESTRIAQELPLLDVMNNIMLPAGNALMHMELTGIKIDLPYIKKLEAKYNAEEKKLLGMLREAKAIKKVVKLNGKDFNPASSLHMQTLLYDVLKCERLEIYRTKTGYSTASDVINQFKAKFPVLRLLLKLAKIRKLLSTYVRPAEGWLSSDGRVHTDYIMTQTVTGRLASRNPNSQNIPRDKNIKRMFIPSEGNVFVQADYSQVELRVIACAANDKQLISIYKKDLDAHRMAGAAMFDTSYDNVTAEQRQTAKSAVSFGLNYGRSAFALAKEMMVPESKAKKLVDDYFKRYKGVAKYIVETKKIARKQGYVESLFGRKRRLPAINSKNKKLKAGAERQAVNSIIQSTASDITLMALDRIHRRIIKDEMKSRLVFTVHDSVLLDVPRDEIDWCKNMLREEMETFEFDWLIVPLKIDIDVMKNWADYLEE